jgi:hypothetical protein
VIGYYEPGKKPMFFIGECHGKISKKMVGDHGFGFDPIFIPDDKNRTFAEMETSEKNSISHRGKSLEKFAKWLGGFQTIIGIIAIILAIVWWSPIQSIVAIIAGLILIVGILPAIPAVGKSLEKLSKWLGSFQTIIGIIAIVVGIWGLL